MKIERLVFPDKGRCEVERVELDEKLGADEVLIKNRISLVSAGTELAMFTRTHRGFDEPGFTYAKYPFKPGYSAVGEVVGGNGALKPGTLVFHASPHATFVKTKSEAALPVPAQMNPERAVFYYMLRISMTSARLAPVKTGEQVLVIGMGLVGNLCAQIYGLCGAGTVAGADLSETRLAKAKVCGIPKAFCVAKKPLAEWVKEELGPRGAELVVEAIGSARAIGDALKVVANRGIVVLLGSPRTKMEIDPYFDLHCRGVALIGAHACNVDAPTRKRDEPLLLEWLNAGRIHVDALVTQRIAFTEALQAYEGLRDKTDEFLGVVLRYP